MENERPFFIFHFPFTRENEKCTFILHFSFSIVNKKCKMKNEICDSGAIPFFILHFKMKWRHRRIYHINRLSEYFTWSLIGFSVKANPNVLLSVMTHER